MSGTMFVDFVANHGWSITFGLWLTVLGVICYVGLSAGSKPWPQRLIITALIVLSIAILVLGI
jgi:hypothetical protein